MTDSSSCASAVPPWIEIWNRVTFMPVSQRAPRRDAAIRALVKIVVA
ncbi:MAG: hypothetical protein R3F14_02065 [Polyangiaceae bacterium]